MTPKDTEIEISEPPSSATQKAKDKSKPTASSIKKTQPKDVSVVMVTASAGAVGMQAIPNLKEMVYENRMTYANEWGYEHMWANISS